MVLLVDWFGLVWFGLETKLFSKKTTYKQLFQCSDTSLGKIGRQAGRQTQSRQADAVDQCNLQHSFKQQPTGHEQDMDFGVLWVTSHKNLMKVFYSLAVSLSIHRPFCDMCCVHILTKQINGLKKRPLPPPPSSCLNKRLGVYYGIYSMILLLTLCLSHRGGGGTYRGGGTNQEEYMVYSILQIQYLCHGWQIGADSYLVSLGEACLSDIVFNFPWSYIVYHDGCCHILDLYQDIVFLLHTCEIKDHGCNWGWGHFLCSTQIP